MPRSDKLFAKQRSLIKAYQKTLAQSRNLGYRATLDIISGTTSNLRTTMKAANANLLASQARGVAALRRLQERAAAKQTRISTRTHKAIAELYGTAVAGGTDFSGMRAASRASAAQQKGLTAAGRLLAQGTAAAAATMEQGVAAAEQAAKYAASQAKLYRAKEDAALIAEHQLALQQMRLQAQLDLENYRKKLAMEAKNGPQGQAAFAVGSFSADAARNLLTIFNKKYVGPDGTIYDASQVSGIGTGAPTVEVNGEQVQVRPVNAADALRAYVQTYGPLDQNQAQVLQAIAAAMYAAGAGGAEGQFNRDPAVIANVVAQQLPLLFPDLTEKQLTKIKDYVLASVRYASQSDAERYQAIYSFLRGLDYDEDLAHRVAEQLMRQGITVPELRTRLASQSEASFMPAGRALAKR